METNIPKTSTAGEDTNIRGNGLGMGLWTPFQPSEMLDLRSFTYDSRTGRIMQEQVKKVPTTEGMPLSVVTHVPVIGDVRENPIAMAMVGSTFMNTNVDNIQRLCQQNEEKEARIRELEERLERVRIDERNLQSFRVSAEKVRRELEEAIIDMYAHLHLFQEATAIIIEQNNKIQTKLTQYKTIREGIDIIDRWITENPDAPPELYRPSKAERKMDLYALDHCQQVG